MLFRTSYNHIPFYPYEAVMVSNQTIRNGGHHPFLPHGPHQDYLPYHSFVPFDQQPMQHLSGWQSTPPLEQEHLHSFQFPQPSNPNPNQMQSQIRPPVYTLMSYFQNKDGQIDVDKMLTTVGKLSTTVQQVSPLFKQLGSFLTKIR